jgi:uncharacterized protein (DUF302 family)
MPDYALSVALPTSFGDAVTQTRSALADQGFGVLTEIDIAATMKAKLDLDLGPYLILGACNPQLAARALAADPAVGVLLPCNVVVRGVDENRTLVQAMDPNIMSTLSDNPDLSDVAGQARQRLAIALAALTTATAS